MRSPAFIVIASSFFLGACANEPVDEPEPTAVTVARNAPTHSVSGGGRVDYDFFQDCGFDRLVAFSCKGRAVRSLTLPSRTRRRSASPGDPRPRLPPFETAFIGLMLWLEGRSARRRA